MMRTDDERLLGGSGQSGEVPALAQPKARRVNPALTRSERIVELLRTLPEARDPLAQGGSETKTGLDDRPLLMSGLWHGVCPPHCVITRRCRSPYAVLEGTLGFMRAAKPRLYWAVSERYIRCQRVVKSVRRTASGTWIDCTSGRPLGHPQGEALSKEIGGKRRSSVVQQRRLIETWNAKVFEADISLGLHWLDRNYPGEPVLPRLLVERWAA